MQKQKQKKVLVVDDDHSIRSFMVSIMRELGFRVCEAPNAEVAIAICHEHEFDVVFTDRQMPGMCGIAFARYLVNVLQRPCQIFLMTGTDISPEEAGPHFHGVLSKPFSIGELTGLLWTV